MSSRGASARGHTLLVGCSFAGLEFLYRYVRRLGRRLAPGELTVVDPRERHPYIPLAHEAMSGARDPDALLFDSAGFCQAVGAEFRVGAMVGLDASAQVVRLADGAEIAYDRAILAIGSVPYVPARFATSAALVPAKFVADALEARDRLRALHAAGVARPRVAVVGGGITGVEWGAELAGSGVDGRPAAVSIVERGPRLLPAFAEPVAARASRVLDSLGVGLYTARAVAELRRHELVPDDGARVPADLVIWAGGVRPAPAVATLDVCRTASGHIAVTPRLAVHGCRNLYAAGDAARIVENDQAWPTMERAIEAIWQGAYLARRLHAGHGTYEGTRHVLRRDFFYGLSLGPRHSLVLYGRWSLDARLFVHFRRWLQWAYYARLRALARFTRPPAGRGDAMPAVRG